MSTSLRFVRKGLSLYHVFDGESQIGWMDDRTIGLLGFDDPADARHAGTTGYAMVVRWHWAVGHDGRGPTHRLPGADAVAEEDRIQVDAAVVGRVLRAPGDGRDGGQFAFELARTCGLPFAASVHLFYRLLAVAKASDPSPESVQHGPADAARRLRPVAP